MKICIVIAFLIISFLSSYGQTHDQVDQLQAHCCYQGSDEPGKSFWEKHTGFFSRFIYGLFHIYQHYISPQDASSCSFEPSCSAYASKAIQEQGLIKGLLNFFDRFSRCNSLSPENYPINEEKRLMQDPLRDYYYEPVP